MKELYIMLTRNGTLFSKLIRFHTKQNYAHVSLLFNPNFSEGYSFSRKNINNPFIGGFKLETYHEWLTKFPHATCCVYKLYVSTKQYHRITEIINTFYGDQDKYTYNLLGVVGRLFNLEITPENSFFCSQFISYVLMEAQALDFKKSPICVTPGDFLTQPELTLIYEGSLKHLVQNPTLINDTYTEVIPHFSLQYVDQSLSTNN